MCEVLYVCDMCYLQLIIAHNWLNYSGPCQLLFSFLILDVFLRDLRLECDKQIRYFVNMKESNEGQIIHNKADRDTTNENGCSITPKQETTNGKECSSTQKEETANERECFTTRREETTNEEPTEDCLLSVKKYAPSDILVRIQVNYKNNVLNI